MRDTRCWQAQMGYLRGDCGPGVRQAAEALARGPVDADRLWPEVDHDDERPTLTAPGVREHFLRVVRSDPALRRSWTENLAKQASRILDGIGRDPGFEREVSASTLQAVLARWASRKSPARVWDDESRRLDYVPEVRGFAYANLLLQIDPAVASVAFEELKLPTFVQQAMQWGQPLSQDGEALLTVVDGAAPVFEGRRWTRNIVALVALELALKHPGEIDEALRVLAYDNPWRDAVGAEVEAAHEAAVRTLRELETRTWFRLLFERMLTRADGLEILLLLVPYVNDKVLRGWRLALDASGWDPYRIARQELANLLARAGIVAADLHQRCDAERELLEVPPTAERSHKGERPVPKGEGGRALRGDGIGPLMGALSMLSAASPSSEVDATWAWFEELLVGCDPSFEHLDHAAGAQSLVRELGANLSRCSDPLATFTKTYRLLEPQRRRAQHAWRYEQYFSNQQSQLLLRVALHAAEQLRGSGEARGLQAEALFAAVWVQARRLWLTVGWGDTAKPEELVALCFAFVPSIFGEKWASVVPALVRPIAGDPGISLRAAALLWLNRVPPDALIASFREASVDLPATAVEERQWWGDARERPPWFEAMEPFLRCLKPEQIQRRSDSIRARAAERSRDPCLRGRDMLEDWLAAEREVAVDELLLAERAVHGGGRRRDG